MESLKPITVYKEVEIYDKHELMAYYRSGEPDKVAEAKEKLIEMMKKYIYSEIEKKYKSFTREREDLYQSCVLKILEDMDTFDPDKGDFIPWFQHSIHNACVTYLSSRYHHSTPYFANKAKLVKRAIEYFEIRGLKWTKADIAQYTKLNRKSVDDAILMIERLEQEGPFEFETDTDEAREERGMKSLETELMEGLTYEALVKAMDKLDPLDRKLIKYRHSPDSVKKKAYKEISEKEGIKVREIQERLNRAIQILRNDTDLKSFVKGEDYSHRHQNDITFIDRDSIYSDNW